MSDSSHHHGKVSDWSGLRNSALSQVILGVCSYVKIIIIIILHDGNKDTACTYQYWLTLYNPEFLLEICLVLLQFQYLVFQQ